MTKRNGSATLVGTLAASVVVAASCSFPSYNITLSGSGGEGSATSSSVSGGGATSSSGSGGSSGSATTSTSASSSSGGACVGADDACDCDDDKVLATSCDGGTDCNDHEPLVHAGQMMFFKDKVPGTVDDYDYDCDGSQMYEIKEVLVCNNVLSCDQTTLRWKTSVPGCGVFGQLGKCKLSKDIVPACIEDLQTMRKQGCR